MDGPLGRLADDLKDGIHWASFTLGFLASALLIVALGYVIALIDRLYDQWKNREPKRPKGQIPYRLKELPPVPQPRQPPTASETSGRHRLPNS